MTSSPSGRQSETGKIFGFATPHRCAFVFRYVLSTTVFFWRAVHRPRFRLFLYEIVYSLCRATSRPPVALRWLRLDG
jgi:hypothetical protein